MKRIIGAIFAIILTFIPLAGRATPPTFTSGFTSNGPTNINNGASYTGSLYVMTIADPLAPVVTVNTTGSSSHTYWLVGHDGSSTCGSGHEAHSAVSPATTINNSAASPNNSITIPTTYLFYDVLKDSTSASLATCVAAGSTVVDTGQATAVYVPPTSNTTGNINGVSLNFTNITGNVANISLNNTINPAASPYSIVNSVATATCSGTASNAIVTCTGGDFAQGEGIAISQAGATPAISAPASLTITNISRAWNEAGTVPGGGGTVTVTHAANFIDDQGTTYGTAPINNVMPELPFTWGSATGKYTQSAGVYTYAAGDAGQPVLATYSWNDTGGATSIEYAVSAFDSSYGLTQATTATTANSVALASLSSLHFNRLAPATVANALGFAYWYSTDAGATWNWLGSTDAPRTFTVSGATNASPIVITAAAGVEKNLGPGAIITCSGIGGNTAANGTFTVQANPTPTNTTFAINASGSGAYTTGGSCTAGGTFDHISPTMKQVKPWFWPASPPISAAIGGPLIGASSTTSVTISALNGTSFTLSSAPSSDFTSQTAIHDNTGANYLAATAANGISDTISTGTTVKLPPGTYYGDWSLPTGVSLECTPGNQTPPYGGVNKNATTLIHVRPGQPLIQTIAPTYYVNGGIKNCGLRGFGAGGLGDQGIVLNTSTIRTTVDHNGLTQFGDQGILIKAPTSASADQITANTVNAVYNHSRIVFAGSFQDEGTDDFVGENEFGGSEDTNSPVSSPALFSDACLLRGGNPRWQHNVCEFGDAAMVFYGTGTANPSQGLLTGNRFEFASGHGILNYSGGVENFQGNKANENGVDTNGSWDGLHNASSGSGFGQVTSFIANALGSDAYKQRHGVWDQSSGVFNQGSYANIHSQITTESGIQLNPNQGAAYAIPNTAIATSSIDGGTTGVSFAGATQPNVGQLTTIAPTNSAPTTITNFCDGPPIGGVCQPEASGRIIRVLGDANTTIADCASATYGCIKTSTRANETLNDLRWHSFIMNRGIWSELNKTAESTPLNIDGALGGLGSTAGATLLQSCTTMNAKGQFTLLTIVNDLNGGACTTAPTYNIRNNTAATTGTALTGSTTAGQVTQAESLAYSAGDQVCLVRTINGGTCTAPIFGVSAQAVSF